MKKNAILLVLAIILLTMALISCSKAQAQTFVQERWEYRSINNSGSTEGFNDLGREGWELVTVTGSNSVYRFYFKRRLQ